uniref:Uncharacterized protein n=1 Tax=Megaselia scalaris TaxID=36166 RepID=T1GWY1_MEGSC
MLLEYSCYDYLRYPICKLTESGNRWTSNQTGPRVADGGILLESIPVLKRNNFVIRLGIVRGFLKFLSSPKILTFRHLMDLVQINPHHSKTASACQVEVHSRSNIMAVLIQEPWIDKKARCGLDINGYMLYNYAIMIFGKIPNTEEEETTEVTDLVSRGKKGKILPNRVEIRQIVMKIVEWRLRN